MCRVRLLRPNSEASSLCCGNSVKLKACLGRRTLMLQPGSNPSATLVKIALVRVSYCTYLGLRRFRSIRRLGPNEL